jgi:hypothetical protein
MRHVSNEEIERIMEERGRVERSGENGHEVHLVMREGLSLSQACVLYVTRTPRWGAVYPESIKEGRTVALVAPSPAVISHIVISIIEFDIYELNYRLYNPHQLPTKLLSRNG